MESDEARPRQRRVYQPRVQVVHREFVSEAPRVSRAWTRLRQVGATKRGEFHAQGSLDEFGFRWNGAAEPGDRTDRAALKSIEFAGGKHLAVAAKDLLNQRRTAAGKAADEDTFFIIRLGALSGERRPRMCRPQFVHHGGGVGHILVQGGPQRSGGLLEHGKRARVLTEILELLGERKRHRERRALTRQARERRLEAGDVVAGRALPSQVRTGIISLAIVRTGRDHRIEIGLGRL